MRHNIYYYSRPVKRERTKNGFLDSCKTYALNPKKPLTLKEALSSVADFRIDRRKKYPLYEILMITVCAMIDGARGPTDFWRFGRGKIGFLRKFLPLVNGIPSHDTFRRVLGKLDTKRFNAAVVRWIQSVADISGDFVSINGKLLRRALTKDGKMPCIVSADSNNRKLVIGQIKADEKSNEISAIPDLLDLLYIKGAIVSIDAAGCQKKIVRKIIRQDGGYVISLKGNQTKMHDEIQMFMQDTTFKRKFKKARTVDKGHGRIETRTCWQTDDIDWFEDKAKWAGLKSVCMVTSEVYDMKKKTTSRETRYFISSMPVDPARALQAIRAHWGVEAMHWILDMDFDEDRSRARTFRRRFAPKCFSAQQPVFSGQCKQGTQPSSTLAVGRWLLVTEALRPQADSGGISVKRKELIWDDDKLLKLMIAA